MPFRPLLAAAIGACLCLPAFANDRRYDVEIVIFENTDTRVGEFERWRPEVTIPLIENAIALDTPAESAPVVRAEQLAEPPEGFAQLPPERRRLGGAIKRLQESGRYRVLRHLAWQQPALGEEEAPSIRIHDGEPVTVRLPIENFDELDALESGSAEASVTGSDTADGDRRDEAPSEDSGVRTFGAESDLEAGVQPLLRPVEIHPLDGTIRLVVSRYLHIYTDLYYTTPVEWSELTKSTVGTAREAPEAPQSGEPENGETDRSADIDPVRIARDAEGRAMLSYPFVQHRRMRSGELHYLDHPVVGMLIRVDRAEGDAADSPDTGAGG